MGDTQTGVLVGVGTVIGILIGMLIMSIWMDRTRPEITRSTVKTVQDVNGFESKIVIPEQIRLYGRTYVCELESETGEVEKKWVPEKTTSEISDGQ
jgi:hypothetical protein